MLFHARTVPYANQPQRYRGVERKRREFGTESAVDNPPKSQTAYTTVRTTIANGRDSVTAWSLSNVRMDSPLDGTDIYLSGTLGATTTVYATGAGTATLNFIHSYTNVIGENVTYRETYDVKAYYNKYNILTVDVTKVS